MSLKDVIRRTRSSSSDNADGYVSMLIHDMVQKRFEEFQQTLPDEIATALQTVLQERTAQALKGDDGDTPTDDQLRALIIPLIPPPKKGDDGKSPTREELLALIRPLIPPAKNGETPTDQRLLALITPLIPSMDEDISDTPDEVVGKVNAAEAKVRQAAIAGLPEDLARIRREIAKSGKGGGGGGVGGGMGNWQHETNNTSSATTTVTTTYKVAASGMAHILRYNGQILAYGQQYTIGADRKTFTFSFTLDNSSTVDITYVRT